MILFNDFNPDFQNFDFFYHVIILLRSGPKSEVKISRDGNYTISDKTQVQEIYIFKGKSLF